ncbi:hypothetical protein LDC_0260 [sediment metagenome]|uniref:Uncharacterized protein n=1 Tax=sediment metagenome TaxID=749907 RepID=D9PFH8_9ZZZZ
MGELNHDKEPKPIQDNITGLSVRQLVLTKNLYIELNISTLIQRTVSNYDFK